MTSQVLEESGALLSPVAGAGRPGEPAWLRDARRVAAEWLTRHGYPDRKDEDWRYLDLRPVLSLPFHPAEPTPPGVGASDLDALAGSGLGGPRLVVVNGRFRPELSRPSPGPAVTRIGSLATAVGASPAALRRCWTGPGGGFRHGFEALNAALACDGAYLEIPARAVLDGPIEIVYLTVADEDLALVSPRSIIVAGSGSTATIVETYLGVGKGRSLTNARTTVLLEPGAAVEHYRFQIEGDDAFHLSDLEVKAKDAGRFASRTLAVGALLARHQVDAELVGPSADVQLDGLFLPCGQQCHDNPVLVDHAAPGGTSRQLYKGIVSGAGHGIFNGRVIVRPAAAGTAAHQTNKNLLLSDRAELDTRPRLEIFNDEVSATHGAAVGQLDLDAVFYLRSRGIPDEAARAMLVAGFAAEVLERFAPGPIRRRAEQLVTSRLQAAVADPGLRDRP